MAKKIPGWVEALLIRFLNQYVPPEVIKAAIDNFKAELIAKAKAWAADTTNAVDDMIVDKLAQAMTVCNPDAQFLCDLFQRGEEAVVDLLRGLAASTDTELDDAMVDILAEAMK